MKVYGWLNKLLESVVIFILCIIGIIALSKSALLDSTVDYVLTQNPLGAYQLQNVPLKSVVLTLIVVTLFLWGVKRVVVDGKKGMGLTSLLFIFCLSPIVANSYRSWAEMLNEASENIPSLGVQLKMLSLYFQNGLTYSKTLELSIVLISGTLFLRFLAYLKDEVRDLLKNGVDESEVKKIGVQSQSLIGLALGLATVSSLLISLIALDFRPILYNLLRYPWGLVIAGVTITSTILASTLYFTLKNSR